MQVRPVAHVLRSKAFSWAVGELSSAAPYEVLEEIWWNAYEMVENAPTLDIDLLWEGVWRWRVEHG